MPHVFNEIAVRRCGNKKLIEAETEKKVANAKLWREKLETEENEEEMERNLYNAHQKLFETELTITKLKQMLDNENI